MDFNVIQTVFNVVLAIRLQKEMVVFFCDYLLVAQALAPKGGEVGDAQDQGTEQFVNAKPDLLYSPSFSEYLEARVADRLKLAEYHVASARLDQAELADMEIGYVISSLKVKF